MGRLGIKGKSLAPEFQGL